MALTQRPKAEQQTKVAECLGCRKGVREPTVLIGLTTGGTGLAHSACKAKALTRLGLSWLRSR